MSNQNFFLSVIEAEQQLVGRGRAKRAPLPKAIQV